MQRIITIVFTLLLAVALPLPGYAANFGAGNLVVVRVGTGVGSLTSASTAVFLDEYTSTGTLVQTLPLPTAMSGNNRPLTMSGVATSEGALRRSTDGRYLTMAGYAATTGTAGIAGTSSATVNRVVARVDATGAIDSTTAFNAYNANNIRGAVTDDGTRFWTVGPTTGVGYVALGGASLTALNGANTRVAGISGGQLYVSSSSSGYYGINSVGSGLPTTAGQTATHLSGFPTTSGSSSYGFVFTDATTMYVADDSAGGGIQKWTSDGSTWTNAYTLGAGTDSYRGLTAAVSGGNVVLYATRKGGSGAAGGGELVKVTDTGSGSAVTLLATAPANTAFRGVDLAPAASIDGSCGTDNNQTLAATAPSNLCAPGGGAASQITGTGHPWNWSCSGVNNGATATCSATIQTYTVTFASGGNGALNGTTQQVIDYGGQTSPVSANADGGYFLLNWTGTNGSGTSTANPLTVNNVTADYAITAHFALNPVNGVCGSDNGKTLAATAPTNLCAPGGGAASQVTGSGHPWNWTCSAANGGVTASCSALIQTYTLTFATDGNGAIDGVASQSIDFGGSSTPVMAKAKDNYYFFNWTGTNSFIPTTADPLTVNYVTASQSFTANFKGGFTIFHVNDTHARLTPHKGIVTEHSITTNRVFEDVGGAAYLASEMLRLTTTQPNSLVIDAGDISEGNPIGDMNGNGSMTQFYTLLSGKLKSVPGRNSRGMDAVVVGNHDVRDANYINNLFALKNSGVPVISVNVRDAVTHQPYFTPYNIVTINGTRIGILGYTTQAAEVGASLASTLVVDPCDWDGASTTPDACHLAGYVNDLRNNQGCDVVILAAHIGHSAIVDPTAPLLVDNASAKVPEIVVSGHWHTWADTVWQPEMLNYKTIFTESASYMKYIGELKVTDAGAYVESAQHVIRDADITPDPDVRTFVNGLITQYNATADAGNPPKPHVYDVVGYTADNLLLDNTMKWWSADEYPWSGNNTAGQWICDAMQWKAAELFGQCDLAMETGGGVRADIPAGPVTYMQIYETFPWNDDTFSRINMTGQEIVNFIKQNNMDAGFSSALDVTAFDGVPTSVKFNGQPIDLNKTYTVAINNYMYAHPPTGWTWSDKNPLTSTVLCRDGIVDYMRQFTAGNPYHVGGDRYHLNTEFSGGYRAVVTMMNDNDTKPTFDDAFIRFLSATPETLARRGTRQVPSDLVNADGAINAANRLSEAEMYRSFLGFKTGALKPGDIIETWGKGSVYGGNPEFVDQEGSYANGVEFKVLGHDDSLAKPAFLSSIGAFWNDTYKNHYVQFLARKTGTSLVADQYGRTLTVMDATGYSAKILPGNIGDTLLISGVPTMESYGLRFRGNNAQVSAAALPSVVAVSSRLDPAPPATTGTPITLTATASTSAGAYYLTPVADAQVVSGKPTTNYGTSTNLYVQSSNAGSYKNERLWLKFDLSGIPGGATISSATLQLWNFNAAGPALAAEVCGGAGDTWSETGITWNTQPSFGAPLSTQTFVAGTKNVWYAWDVTPFVQNKWSDNKLVSLVVKAVDEDSTASPAPSYAFDAKEYGSSAPILQVTTLSAEAATVTQVQFFYRYSTNNVTWGSWTPFATSTVAPYAAPFSYPQGQGYYEFSCQASDSAGNVEPAPYAAQAFIHYTSTPAYHPIVSTDNVYQRYDGTPKQVVVTTIPENAPYSVTYDGSAIAPVMPGAYGVTVTATSGENTVTTTGSLTIAKALAAVSFDNLTFYSDGTPKAAPVSTIPSGLAVNVTYNGSTTPPHNPGSYAVAAVVNDIAYHGGVTGALVIERNVSSAVKATTSGFLYSRASKKFSGALTLTNIGNTPLSGSFSIQLNNLTAGVTLVNATGIINGYPYLGLSATLNPGQSTTVPLTFTNPATALINFTPVTFLGQ